MAFYRILKGVTILSPQVAEIIISKLDSLSKEFSFIDSKISHMENQLSSLCNQYSSLQDEVIIIKDALPHKNDIKRLECMLNSAMDIIEQSYRNMEHTSKTTVDKLDNIKHEVNMLGRKVNIQDYEIVSLKKVL